MTNEQHNKYIAFTFLAHGGFQLLMLPLMGLMFYFILSNPLRPGDPRPPMEFFIIFFGIMAFIQTIFAIPSFVAAYALLKRKSWARMASIIAGVLSAMHIPIGTAACVYAMWFFFGENWKSVYQNEEFEDGYREHLQLMERQPWTNAGAHEFRSEENRTNMPPDWR